MGDETGFSFSDEVCKSFYVKTTDTRLAPVSWKMSCAGTNAFIEGGDSFTPGKIAVWGDYYVLSCEVFIPISLAPGQEITWQRRWKFGV